MATKRRKRATVNHRNTRVLHRLTAPLVLLLALSVLPLVGSGGVARAASSVPVRYDAPGNVIYLGDDYSPDDPAQAPFVGYPSHPDAPKVSISIPEVQAALAAQGQATLLTQQGTTWTLSADIVISQNARLDAARPSVTELRLDSTPGARSPALTRIVARGGQLAIDGLRVLSWDGSGPDTNYADGRSYLLAENGGRMDIRNAEVSHLGWSAGEPSGLAWRKPAVEGDPTDPNVIRTGATGSIINSTVHDNFFGQYSYEAYGLVVRNNAFHNNAEYGFDARDYSTGFQVAYNKVYDNGKHGINFSRGCMSNEIHNNEVYGNAEHGIMLDRGSNNNVVKQNLVYNNGDGIAIFQSSNNLIESNTLRGNERGIRINATFDRDDRFDSLANDNVVLNNTIEGSSQYGIYLYERADNTTIQGNSISGSAASGMYIKTGGNTIIGNSVCVNGTGMTIIGGEQVTQGGLPASHTGGHQNVIAGNTVEDNNAVGIQLTGAVDTVIGRAAPQGDSAAGNTIRTNGTHGISMDSGATTNSVIGNSIQGNQTDGVLVEGAGSVRNTISQNSIVANRRTSIKLQDGGNQSMPAPVITSVANAVAVTGTASAGATVEVYRDSNGQSAAYKGRATAASDGTWSFALLPNDDVQQGAITALAIDAAGNTSPFSTAVADATQASYTIGTGSNGETTVFISGEGANITLPEIQHNLKVISPTAELLVLEDAASKVWLSNVSLFIGRGVTLTLTTDTVSWLKLRSQEDDIQLAPARAAADEPPAYNYKSFTTLRTYNGAILIDGVKITSWDPNSGTFDTNIANGRSYLLAKYDARLDVKNADLSYLGSSDGESYGVSWRDINESAQPDVLLTRVTGDVVNSTFSNNYYGIYTYQARDMLFRGNTFRNNIGYGFDPHDFSHNFLIEDNQAYENGNHGFIISRGCNNFVFRRNKSYNNRYTVGNEDRNAHGFIIDPGSPNSRYPQEPSFDNLLEDNQAYGNDGYGLRILGSISNTVRLNSFSNNLQGITLEQGSTANLIDGNTITGSGLYGIYAFRGADGNTLTGNTITTSGKHGIYLKTGGNLVTKNTITENGAVVEGVPSGSGIAMLQETEQSPAAALITRQIGALAQISAVANNVMTENSIARNADDGIELKNATGTLVEANIITDNGGNGVYLANGSSTNMVKANSISGNIGHGIRTVGADVVANTWTANAVYENRAGGIVNTSGANNGIKPPEITRAGNEIVGTTLPNALVELFSDDRGQGRYFEARVASEADGSFRVAQNWQGRIVNATVTDQAGNSSGFAVNLGFNPSVGPLYLPLVSR